MKASVMPSRSGHAGHHVGAPSPVGAFEELRLQSGIFQDGCAVLRSLAFAFSAALTPVGGVDADKVAAEIHDVDLCLSCRVFNSHGP